MLTLAGVNDENLVAKQQMPLTADDVLRMSIEGPREGNGNGVDSETRIVLPGIRKIIQAKTAGQAEYMKLMAENDIVVGIGPAGTGKTYLAVAAAVDALARKRVRRIVLARPAVEAGESPATCRRRSIRICARCTMRSRT